MSRESERAPHETTAECWRALLTSGDVSPGPGLASSRIVCMCAVTPRPHDAASSSSAAAGVASGHAAAATLA
eukprot:4502673-Prymnesium_polylepis.1